jgi:hypothetical protein
MKTANSWISPRLIVGLALITFGLLFTLDNLDIVEASGVVDFWPVVLIAVGLLKLLQGGARIGGALLTGIGVLLLGDTLDLLRFRDFLPLFIVFAGVVLIYGAFRKPSAVSGSGVEQAINAFALMGGVERKSASNELRGGELTAIMGGCEIDLTAAKPEGKEIVIETFAMWGGISIRIPHGWGVISRVTPIMGAFEDKSFPVAEPRHWLVLNGLVIMGGVEVASGPPAVTTAAS